MTSEGPEEFDHRAAGGACETAGLKATGEAWLQAPFGPVLVCVRGGRVWRVSIGPPASSKVKGQSLLAREVADALQRWLAGRGPWPDDVPLAPAGTPFQQRVWSRLRGIPPGERRTYGELARALGTSPRAVGNACRANPIPLLIPCHRVVSRDGLGGYAGATRGRWAEIKRWLLELEHE